MNNVYLLTGGNVGNREQYLQESAGVIEGRCGRLVGRSSVYETAAWGKTDQAAFLNQVLQLSTRYPPEALLEELLAIEKIAGRARAEKYGPRTIDIDILLYNSEVIESGVLSIPHLQLANRRFALVPLCEIAADFIHPVLKKTIRQLLQDCTDTLPVKKFSEV